MTLTNASFKRVKRQLLDSTWPIDDEIEAASNPLEGIPPAESFEQDNRLVQLWKEIEADFVSALQLLASNIRKGTTIKPLFKRAPNMLGREISISNRSVGFFIQAGLLDHFDYETIRDVKCFAGMILANRNKYNEWRVSYPKLSAAGQRASWVKRIPDSILMTKSVSPSTDFPALIGRAERLLPKLRKILKSLRNEEKRDAFASALDPNIAMRKGGGSKGAAAPDLSHDFRPDALSSL